MIARFGGRARFAPAFVSLIPLVLFLAPIVPATAQDGVASDSGQVLSPFVIPAGKVVVSERSDFSRYVNDRYVGLSSREARLALDVTESGPNTLLYRGEVLVLEETLRNASAAGARLDDVLPVSFTLRSSGMTVFSEDPGYPILRGVPAPPPAAVSVGGAWTAPGVVVVRPVGGAPATRVSVMAEYEYRGPSVWGGRPALAVRARYAVRYRGEDRMGDPNLRSAVGGRTADILLDPEDGSTLFVRETVDETFTYADGSRIRLKGFILHFHRGSLPTDRQALLAALGTAGSPDEGAAAAGGMAMAGGASSGGSTPVTGTSAPGQPTSASSSSSSSSGTPAIGTLPDSSGDGSPFQVAQGDRGVVLILFDLRFAADSDQLLTSERGRLDAIADALKKIPDRTFLVEGHAADVGRPEGQYELSEARAKRIVAELVARGLPPSRFIYRGLGGDVPIAPNDTDAGRARNRRVEITVLD